MPLNRRQKTIAVSILVSGVLAVVSVGGAAWWALDWMDPFNDLAFTPEAWAERSWEDRAPMARDLIRNHLPSRLSRGEAEALLGPPDDVLTGPDSGDLQLLGSEALSYNIGT